MILLSIRREKEQNSLINHALLLDGATDSPDIDQVVETRKNRSQPQNKKEDGRHVVFTSVDVRYYEQTLTGRDLNVTLDWQHGPTRSIAVDAYESIRERQTRLPRGHLRRLTIRQREKLLDSESSRLQHDATTNRGTRRAWV